MSANPAQVEQDSRGILAPAQLLRHVTLNRYPPGQALADLVEWFWAVSWDLPPGAAHRQQVLTHPGANLSVGTAEGGPDDPAARPDEARLHGVARRLSTRTLIGRGRTVAALLRPGGLGAFAVGSAAAFTDRVVPLGAAIAVDEPGLLKRMAAEPDEAARAGALRDALERAADPARTPDAARVAAVARLAEAGRGIRTTADLAASAGVSARTLQRLFLRYAGVSPLWVIRRYRLLEAAEAARSGAPPSWAQVAADLGYCDQAHLTRDFRAATGQTPAGYARAQRPPG